MEKKNITKRTIVLSISIILLTFQTGYAETESFVSFNDEYDIQHLKNPIQPPMVLSVISQSPSLNFKKGKLIHNGDTYYFNKSSDGSRYSTMNTLSLPTSGNQTLMVNVPINRETFSCQFTLHYQTNPYNQLWVTVKNGPLCNVQIYQPFPNVYPVVEICMTAYQC